MQEKYGFVYIWYDKKHKRYYVGSHWGTENDGYICSSRWMRKSYKRRPNDFKRRTIKKVYDRKTLLIEEHNYLSMMKDDELGKKYYNLTNHLNGHWSTDDNLFLTVGEKISRSHKSNPNWGSWSIGKVVSEETKQKLREANKKQFEDDEQRQMRRKKSLELWNDPEYRKTNTENKKGKKQSQETIQKRKDSIKERRKTTPPKQRPPKSEQEKQRISLMTKGTIWINNGIKNKRINKDHVMPDGYCLGKLPYRK
jgi:hypothetical protein